MTRFASFADSARLAAAERPGDVAVVDGGGHWTWRDLDERAGAVAGGLVRAGVRPGDRVALLTRPSVGAVAVLHGIARVGAVAAPLRNRPDLDGARHATAAIDPKVVISGIGFETAAGVPRRHDACHRRPRRLGRGRVSRRRRSTQVRPPSRS